jgi:hypothetical protein
LPHIALLAADRGAAHLVIATLLFAATLTLGLAVDITRIGIAWREASYLAATAAEAGAGWIDEAAALQDRIEVAGAAAREAAMAVADGEGRSVMVTTAPDRVCVRVGIRVHPSLLALVGAGPKDVSALACAEPRMG